MTIDCLKYWKVLLKIFCNTFCLFDLAICFLLYFIYLFIFFFWGGGLCCCILSVNNLVCTNFMLLSDLSYFQFIVTLYSLVVLKQAKFVHLSYK